MLTAFNSVELELLSATIYKTLDILEGLAV